MGAAVALGPADRYLLTGSVLLAAVGLGDLKGRFLGDLCLGDLKGLVTGI